MTIPSQVQVWHVRAQIDYVHHYMSLYASFNAWYSQLTGLTNDRQAINALQRGNPLWDDFKEGRALAALKPSMRQLVECTQREPLSYASPHWRGVVQHIYDWPSLLEYWYRVRCLVMHGSEIKAPYVYLAYQTLNHFMSEVIKRQRY